MPFEHQIAEVEYLTSCLSLDFDLCVGNGQVPVLCLR